MISRAADLALGHPLENSTKAFALVCAISTTAILSVVIWAIAKYPTEPTVGQRFVMDEIPIIPWVGIYFKPITIIVFLGFLAWASGLESVREYAERLPLQVCRLLVIAFSLIAPVYAYEVAWNFVMWSDAHILAPSTPVDLLYNNLNASMSLPIDFTFATKRDTLYLAVSLYSVFFIQTLRSVTRPQG